MDRTAAVFKQTVDMASKYDKSMIAVKFSGLVDMECLKQLNRTLDKLQ